MSTLVEEMNRLYRNHVQVRPAKNLPRHRPGKPRKRLSMRPEKRPQTIMEQYLYREMMRQPHNKPLLKQECIGRDGPWPGRAMEEWRQRNLWMVRW